MYWAEYWPLQITNAIESKQMKASHLWLFLQRSSTAHWYCCNKIFLFLPSYKQPLACEIKKNATIVVECNISQLWIYLASYLIKVDLITSSRLLVFLVFFLFCIGCACVIVLFISWCEMDWNGKNLFILKEYLFGFVCICLFVWIVCLHNHAFLLLFSSSYSSLCFLKFFYYFVYCSYFGHL